MSTLLSGVTSSRLWSSPTAMTWANTFVRSLGMLFLLPLVLATSTPAEIIVWMLLSNASFYVALADFGFLPTFSRAVAHAMADRPSAPSRLADPGIATAPFGMPTLVGTMRQVYGRAGATTFVAMLAVGTIALLQPIAAVRSPEWAWFAAAAVLLGSTVSVFGNQYVAFLTGTNHVAVVQRTLAGTGLAGILSGLALLLSAQSAFTVIVAQQLWVIVGVQRCAMLATRANGGHRLSRYGVADRGAATWIWTSAWRSGLSTLMTIGSLQLSNFFVAQAPDRVASASYLLSLRILQAISQFSQAPFYSRIPLLNRLRAESDREATMRVAMTAMRQSHWSLVLGFVAAGLVGQQLLQLIGSNVAFASPTIWGILGLAMMGERYGAMHIQLYSTTNHIVWHIAAARHFVAFAGMGVLLYPAIGLLAVPVALLVAYWGFYVGYCTRLSYRSLGVAAAAFERTVLWPPLATMLLYVVASLVIAAT